MSVVSVAHFSSQTSRYLVTLIAATVLFGSSFPATKLLLNDIPPLMLVAMRFLCAALSLLPILALQARRQPVERRQPLAWSRIGLIALLQTAGSMGLLNIGLQYTSPAHASIIMASNPLLVAVIALLVFGERLHRVNCLGLLVAFAGVVLCVSASAGAAQSSFTGDAVVALGAACWAVATLAVKRFGTGMTVWQMNFWQMLIGAIALFGLALLRGETFAWPPTAHAWLLFAWLALPATTGAMVLWFKALQMGGAVLTSSFLFLSPLFSILISWGLLGYPLQAREVIGGIVIGVGIALLSRQGR